MSRKFNVAIVEDDGGAAAELKAVLHRFGAENGVLFDITHVSSAEELLENYTPKYDICFMDIELPGKDGMAAAGKLRMFDTNIVLIFCYKHAAICHSRLRGRRAQLYTKARQL